MKSGKLSAVRFPARIASQSVAGRCRLSVIRRLLRYLRSRVAEFSRRDFLVRDCGRGESGSDQFKYSAHYAALDTAQADENNFWVKGVVGHKHRVDTVVDGNNRPGITVIYRFIK